MSESKWLRIFSARAPAGEIDVSIDPHQKKAHLKREHRVVITADI